LIHIIARLKRSQQALCPVRIKGRRRSNVRQAPEVDITRSRGTARPSRFEGTPISSDFAAFG
jgi:hypothetical protein